MAEYLSFSKAKWVTEATEEEWRQGFQEVPVFRNRSRIPTPEADLLVARKEA